MPFEVASLEIWRRQFTTGSLSKKEKRKDRYNCMCVCVLSAQDNSDTEWVWCKQAVCVHPACNAQLLEMSHLHPVCHICSLQWGLLSVIQSDGRKVNLWRIYYMDKNVRRLCAKNNSNFS